MLKVVEDAAAREELAAGLDEIVREGAGGCWPRRWRPRSRRTSPRTLTSATRLATGWWSQRTRPVAAGDHRRRRRGGVRAAGGRPAGGRGDRAAAPVSQFDPAAVVPPLAEGGRGAAAAVPARFVQQGLRAGVGGVLRHQGGAIRVGDHPVDHDLAGGAAAVSPSGLCPAPTTCTCGW